MKLVNLLYDDDYDDVDIICVPDAVANNIGSVVGKFQRWIADERNVHSYWTTSRLGFKSLAIDTDAFIWWLNEHYNDCESAYIVYQHVKYCEELPTAEF